MSGKPHRVYTVIAIALGAILFVILITSTDWKPYTAWLFAWSGITFISYGFDKLQAKRHGQRVPELTLHGLALAGGVFGGWAGMAVFWHKVRSASFWLVLILSTAIHIALGYFLLS